MTKKKAKKKKGRGIRKKNAPDIQGLVEEKKPKIPLPVTKKEPAPVEEEEEENYLSPEFLEKWKSDVQDL